MIKKIRNILITALSLSVLAMPVLVPATASAQAFNNELTGGICSGVQGATQSGQSINLNNNNLDSGVPCNSDPNAGNSLGAILSDIINVMSIIIGVIAVIMIIVGGFKYVTSGGNDSSVAGAKNTIIYAIVGLVIVALAQVIVHFVLTRFNS